MEHILSLLKKALDQGGSDIFIIPGSPVVVKAGGKMSPLTENRLMPADATALIGHIYELAHRKMDTLEANGDDDFSFSVVDMSRFRCNAYRQRGTLAATCRIVTFGLPDAQKMHIPKQVVDLAELHNGMVLVTGPAGSGKSTTLACLVDRINNSRSGHIVTIEDPIEYLHSHRQSLVSQREVPEDAPTFPLALRAALRQAPDVIMLGEMRDTETIRTAISAAETGHLLLSSLHTIGASKTIDRMIDAFPAEQQHQIRMQLSMVLRAVVSQRLLPGTNGGLVPVYEVMTVTPAVQNLIREGRTHQLDNVISGGQNAGMLSMNKELDRLAREGLITREVAAMYTEHTEVSMARR
ncbi:MAG: PilT/PilU family type 4a pilus ATPase [Clostridia bacterium]|nr:PilT/PilU family type 4a pilus ATPase [Clostridia bacterium]MBR6809751.1 PilT/PilU family type 4a pilus ATPase [Clostridia bacterium]